MAERPFIDWIVEAFQNLQNRAHLSQAYEEVRRLGYDRGGEDLDKIVRSEIQKHSRDSARFTGNPEDDLFAHVGDERSGVWELREPYRRLTATEPTPVMSAVEGRVLLRLHKVKERKAALVRAKKQAVWAATGRLVCEVCDFDFAIMYGALGSGFAECHHTQPLAEATAERLTTLADLVVVCANCHRMLHRRPWHTVGELRELVHSRRAGKHTESLFGARGRVMTDANDPSVAGDPHNLTRFVQAQAGSYELGSSEQALAEIRSGGKRSHWMWYIFPQFDGLWNSSTSKRYSIKSVAEAEAYLRHPVLGPRLVECAEAALRVQGRTALEVFGSPDHKKVRACATLFAHVSSPGSAFHQLLDKYFQGRRSSKTLSLLASAPDVK